MENIKLNVKDMKLLAELEKNGRAPFSRIAKSIGVSKEVANYRFKRLVENGLIKGFFPVIDYFALGYRCYRLIINLENIKYHIRKNIIEDLRKMKDVDTTVFLFSEWDVEILVWVKTPGEFYEFYNKIIDMYSEYMASKDFSLVTRMYFLANDYLHKVPYSVMIGDTNKIEKIDGDDEKILDEIKKDPRQELSSMAAKLNISLNTVQYRLKQLYSKNIIKGIIPILNVSLLGYNRYKIELILSKQALRSKVINYLKTRNEVTKISEIIGRNDMSFEANFKTNAELDTFLEDLRLNSSNVQNFEVMNMIVE